jgi:hypothetical protein
MTPAPRKPPSAASQLDPRKALHPRSIRTFALVLTVTVLAKGAAFLPAYSIDDYYLVLQSSPSKAMLRQGRFGQALLVQLLYRLQLEPGYARVFFVACGLVAGAFLATLVVRHWNLERKGWLAVAVAAIVANHPYTAELFTFRVALGVATPAFALLALLLIPRRWSPSLVLLGSALFAVALSIYQVVLQYSLMIVLMGVALWLARYLVLGSTHGWPARLTSRLSLKGIARHRQAGLLACTLLGTVAYLAFTWATVAVLNVSPGQRMGLVAPADVEQRLVDVANVLRQSLLTSDSLVAGLAQGSLLLLLLSAAAGLIVRARPWNRWRPQLLVSMIVLLIAASLIWTLGVNLVLRGFWPVSRVMSHSGVFWGGVLAIAYQCTGAALVRRNLALLSFVIMLSFIGSNNHILNDQIRLNMRDTMKANRILARLEMLPGFAEADGVAVEGKTWRYPLGYKTAGMDMNISAFGADWSKLAILREVSGYDLKSVEEGEPRKAVAAEYCQGVAPWPGPESVAIRDQMAIVCLGD